MTLSSLLILLPALATGLDPGVEALPCPTPVSAWTGTIGPSPAVFDAATDSAGNVIICGHFQATPDFDPTDGVVEHTSNGGKDGFVTKIGVSGSYGWTYVVGGDAGSDTAKAVIVDSDGTIVTAGAFRGTVDFDPTEGLDEHTSLGNYATFITKLGYDGTYLWTATLTGTGEASAQRTALDPLGNIVLIGAFLGSIDFDPGAGVDYRAGINDVFVTKLGPDGSHQWTHTYGSSGFDVGSGIVVDPEGNIYTTGYYAGTVDFDPSDGTDWHTMLGAYEDVFITKLYADGSYAWTRTYDVRYPEGRGTIAVDGSGAPVVTTYFRGTVDFDPTDGVDLRTSQDDPDFPAGCDIVVTKLNTDGSYAWTWTTGGPLQDIGLTAGVDADGNVFVAGSFRETVDFDAGPNIDLHSSKGGTDIFVTKLGSDGSYHWTRSFGGDRPERPKVIAVSPEGNVFVAGSLKAYPPHYADFDPGCEVDIHCTHIQWGTDTFITKLVCPEVTGDFDGNGVVDLRDAGEFQLCFTDEGPATCGDGCSRLDLHPDDDIDLDDYTAFRKRLTGPQPRELINPTSPITTHRERPGGPPR